jgi:transcriptional regulator with XRE-family HTH domain
LIPERTRQLMKEQGLHQVDFARVLNDTTGKHANTKQSVIANWVGGRLSRPDYFFLMYVYEHTALDWLRQWALDCMKAMRPEAWG